MANALAAGGLEEVPGAPRVHEIGTQRVEGDLADIGHRREVDDGVAVLDRAVQRVGIQDVADEAIEPVGDVTCREDEVEDARLMAELEEAADHVGADESRSARDEDSHTTVPSSAPPSAG
jgi:hypothetical protein